MSSYIFQKIAKEGDAAGVESGSIESRDWFRDQALTVGRVNVQQEMTNRARLHNRIIPTDIGRMYHFFYDPKHKDKLPYYDRFPLIFVMERYSDGFLGLNLHYLGPVFRARLMDALYTIARNDAVRDSKKVKMSYALLADAAKFKYFRPCVKRYLENNVRSRFLYIPAEEWDIALMLPTERFKKSKKSRVWKDSKRSLRTK
jgi:hypothetical protein